ncbi:stage V sporulation protein AE [uncultured Clostridium sp.]|uniref:stage V sporulation protein AE n=1 Tax=uncultured Clostridium sp. TaxID=59620 RepID=UPI002602DD05|nr:stage V sporulation protein AE [uncultured Clostridium sp.]
MKYILSFVVGGGMCVVGQIIKDKTGLKPAKMLILFLTIGFVLGLFGIYEKIIRFAGAGASVPLPSFGYSLSKGVMKAVREEGIIGIFTGGLKGCSGGIGGAIVFAYIIALMFNPKGK